MRNPVKYIFGIFFLILSVYLIDRITGMEIGLPEMLLNILCLIAVSEITDMYKDKYPFDRLTYYAAPFVKGFVIHSGLILIRGMAGLLPSTPGWIIPLYLLSAYAIQFLFYAFLDKTKEWKPVSTGILFGQPESCDTGKIKLPPLPKLTDRLEEKEKKIIAEILNTAVIQFEESLGPIEQYKKYTLFAGCRMLTGSDFDEKLENLRGEIADNGILVINYIPSLKADFNNRDILKIPRAELWGRLHYCGYEVIGEIQREETSIVASVKKLLPAVRPAPTRKNLIKLDRIGYRGTIFKVFKLRSMYPYSEFIQKKVFEINNFGSAGKLNNDFRITPAGKIIRKYWIDEIPQIVNWLKSDIKLVGIRGMSSHYFSLYPDDYRELFVKVKPGLIPPIFDDNQAGNFARIVETEKRYLEGYLKAPFKTDLKCMISTLYNIFFKGFRSR